MPGLFLTVALSPVTLTKATHFKEDAQEHREGVTCPKREKTHSLRPLAPGQLWEKGFLSE